MLHILMNHLLTKTGSDILPLRPDAKTIVTNEGDAVVMLGNEIPANEGPNIFGDVLATLESQERPNSYAAEVGAQGHALGQDIDTGLILSDKDKVDIKDAKTIRTGVELADMRESPKPEENSQLKLQPKELKSGFVFREIETEIETETSPRLEFSTLRPDVEEVSSILREPSEAHAASSAQQPQYSAVFESHSPQAEPNSLPLKMPTRATENVMGEREQGLQAREKALSLLEPKARQSSAIDYKNNAPSEVREDAPARLVSEAAPHHEILLKPAGLIDHFSQFRQSVGQLQIPTKEREVPAGQKESDKTEKLQLARGDMTNSRPRRDMPEFPRYVAPAQNSVVAKFTQPELSASATEVPNSLQDRENPEVPRLQHALRSDTKASVSVSNPDKSALFLSSTSLASQTPAPQPQAHSIPEMVSDTPPPLTSLGTMETIQFSKHVPATLDKSPELPRHVAQQMATAVRSAAEKSVEITLKPAELGRVQISMSTSEVGVVVHVIAERPETLELMRRHIDQLAGEFHDIGYGQSEFRFDGAGSDENQARDDQTNEHSRTNGDSGVPSKQTANDAEHLAMQNLIDLDRVDIRI